TLTLDGQRLERARLLDSVCPAREHAKLGEELGPRGRRGWRGRRFGGEPAFVDASPELVGPLAGHAIELLERVVVAALAGEPRRLEEGARLGGEGGGVALGGRGEGPEIARLGGERQERRSGARVAPAHAASERPPRVVAPALGERKGRRPGGLVE